MTIWLLLFNTCHVDVTTSTTGMKPFVKPTSTLSKAHKTFMYVMVPFVPSVSRRKLWIATQPSALLMKQTNFISFAHPMFMDIMHIVPRTVQKPLPIARSLYVNIPLQPNPLARNPQDAMTPKEESHRH